MNDVEARSSANRLHDQLDTIVELLRRHKLVERVVHNQQGSHQDLVETLVHRQSVAELQRHLDELHPADIAFILESLPLDDRLTVWQLVKADRDGDILLEVSDAVRESLIADMDRHEILAAVEPLDADELADLVEDLPTAMLPELMASLDSQQREQVQSALSYEDDKLGALMDFEMVTIREDVSLEVVLRYLRRFEELPPQTDKLFVINHDNLLTGVLPLHWLLVNSPDKMVSDVMAPDVNTFHPHDDAYEVAQAFERYDLVTAPVVDGGGHLIGRITIDAMVDVIREESEAEMLGRGRSARGGGYLRLDLGLGPQPLGVAGDQPGDGVSRLPGHRPVRRRDREAGRTGDPDADRRGHRRQLRQPDHHHDRARHGPGSGQRQCHPPTVAQGTGRGAVQRHRLGRRDRRGRGHAVSQPDARCGHDGGDDAQPAAGRLHGCRHSR